MQDSEKLVYDAKELAAVLGICLPRAYDLMRSRDFPAIQVTPRRRVVPRAALEDWLQRQANRGQE